MVFKQYLLSEDIKSATQYNFSPVKRHRHGVAMLSKHIHIQSLTCTPHKCDQKVRWSNLFMWLILLCICCWSLRLLKHYFLCRVKHIKEHCCNVCNVYIYQYFSFRCPAPKSRGTMMLPILASPGVFKCKRNCRVWETVFVFSEQKTSSMLINFNYILIFSLKEGAGDQQYQLQTRRRGGT